MAIAIFINDNDTSEIKAEKSFPYTSDPDDLGSRILNEDNITNIIKCICNSDTFVIRKDSTMLEFVIKGYYFKIDTSKLQGINSKPLYAGISITEPTIETGTDNDSTTSTTISYGSTLQKLIIKNNEFDGCIQLLDSDGNIPDHSKIRFNFNQVEIPNNISCGNV